MEGPYLNLFVSLIISDLPILDTLSVIPHTPLYTVLNYRSSNNKQFIYLVFIKNNK